MKKFLSIFFTFGFILNAHAGIITSYNKEHESIKPILPTMTVKQFEEYKNAVNYIECKHQNGNYCDGYNSLQAAKKYVDSLQKHKAPVNAVADKQILDAKMKSISKDMDEFGNFKTKSGKDNKAFATSAQLAEYEKAVDYLVCVYSNAKKCSGFTSAKSARQYAQDIKENYRATGLNANKKKKLDNKAQKALGLISVDDAKDFVKSLSSISPVQYLDVLHDSSVVVSKFTMPGENSLAAAERGEFNTAGLNSDAEKAEFVTTKKEFAEMVLADSGNTQTYSSPPAYLEGVSMSKQTINETSYKQSVDKKQVDVIMLEEIESPGMSMKDKITTTLSLKRYKEHGYEIKIARQEVVAENKIDPSVYSEDKLPVIDVELKSTIMDYNNIDEGWQNRYADIEKEDSRARKIDGNYMMLEYAVDVATRLNAKADKLKTEAESAKLNESQKAINLKEAEKLELDAATALKDARQYYDNLGEFKDVEKVKNIRSKYLGLL